MHTLRLQLRADLVQNSLLTECVLSKTQVLKKLRTLYIFSGEVHL